MLYFLFIFQIMHFSCFVTSKVGNCIYGWLMIPCCWLGLKWLVMSLVILSRWNYNVKFIKVICYLWYPYRYVRPFMELTNWWVGLVDLEVFVWLKETLKNLNTYQGGGVTLWGFFQWCLHQHHPCMQNKKFKFYIGNYDQYCQTWVK